MTMIRAEIKASITIEFEDDGETELEAQAIENAEGRIDGSILMGLEVVFIEDTRD